MGAATDANRASVRSFWERRSRSSSTCSAHLCEYPSRCGTPRLGCCTLVIKWRAERGACWFAGMEVTDEGTRPSPELINSGETLSVLYRVTRHSGSNGNVAFAPNCLLKLRRRTSQRLLRSCVTRRTYKIMTGGKECYNRRLKRQSKRCNSAEVEFRRDPGKHVILKKNLV